MTFDPNNPTASGMVLTFDDEFDKVSWSDDNAATGSNWTDHGSNPGIGIETATTSALSLNNGVLTMTASDNNGTWDSGFFQSVNTSGQGWTQKYGYFEADIKLPPGVNSWPGFWLYHTSGPASELDIMESGGQATPTAWAGTVHDGYGNQNGNNVQDAGTDLSAGYHRFGMLWDPNSSEITWFLDGKEVMTAPKYGDTDQSPMTMILNLAVENNGGGSTPMSMYVDYVRAYQFASQDPTAVTPEAVSAAAGNTDAVASVDALGHSDGAVATGPTTTTGDGSSSPPTPVGAGTDPGTSAGPDSLTLHVSGDHYNGDPQILVTVDGKQVGTYDVTADHSQGQWQDITVNGNFDPSTAHQVQVQFVNDAWDGTSTADGHDRNVYVGSLTMNGEHVAGTAATTNTGANHTASSDANATELYTHGAASYSVAAASTGTGSSTPVGAGTDPGTSAGPDSLTLHVSGDHYNGDPQILVTVDGKQVGTYDVTADHSQGQWQDITVNGNFDPSTAHQVQVQFVNDAWDGTSTADGHDRNVYVGSLTMNGEHVAGTAATTNTGANHTASGDANATELYAPGTASYDVAAGSPGPESTTTAEGTSPTLSPSFTDGSGHDVFVFSSDTASDAHIANFNAGTDILDLAPVLKAIGYTGSDPVADHVVDLVQSGDSTAVVIDPTGHDASHGTTLVTLDHVLPQNVPVWH